MQARSLQDLPASLLGSISSKAAVVVLWSLLWLGCLYSEVNQYCAAKARSTNRCPVAVLPA